MSINQKNGLGDNTIKGGCKDEEPGAISSSVLSAAGRGRGWGLDKNLFEQKIPLEASGRSNKFKSTWGVHKPKKRLGGKYYQRRL